jgi:hypothetical protein
MFALRSGHDPEDYGEGQLCSPLPAHEENWQRPAVVGAHQRVAAHWQQAAERDRVGQVARWQAENQAAGASRLGGAA